ncbi:MAG: hypothetical protein NTZ83_04930 [Candidatus Pacearchaeota archaeon]|nr:hypothetical protein [Candidatus Pacearchaeota archaeon]
MRFNYKKISAIAASAIMAGMTFGFAAAANYPAPFVSGGVANVAVVYGTGAGVSSLDLVQAGNIQTSLGTYVEGGTVIVEGGESFTLEKNSEKFNVNDDLNNIYTSLDDGELTDFLADGTYKSGDVDEDYTQTITMAPSGTNALELFADNDYNSKTPTMGFRFTNNDPILDYTIDFGTAGVLYDEILDTDIPLMGNTYYVLAKNAANTSIELLDSAEKVVLNEGESKTVGEHTVSIEYIEDGSVKFNVDGEITDKMSDHEYEELADGSYIVANEIMWASKEVGISKVEFSIGNGKIVLTDTEEVEVNDETVDGLSVDFDTTGTGATMALTGLTFSWVSDGEQFLTEEDALSMPTFETIKVVYDGLTFPDSSETITIDNGETITIEMGNYELPLMFLNATGAFLGEDDYLLKLAQGVNTTAYADHVAATDLTLGIEVKDGNRFLVTKVADDLGDVETLYYEVTKVDYNSAADFEVTLNDLIGDNDITFTDDLGAGAEEEVGDVTVNLTAVKTDYAYLNFTGTGLRYDVAVSDTGMLIELPTAAEVDALTTSVTAPIKFIEANEDGDVNGGDDFTVNVLATTSDKLHVTTITGIDTLDDDDDIFVGYNPSKLATKVTHDQTGDENNFEAEYYGAEVTAKVMVVGGGTVSGGENTLGNVLVTDAEVSNVATKNLIVVGGSCINSAAAALVDGTKCGAAWTAATGIGSGQFLIKGYADSTITSELALLVAGYDAEDTVKATTYLTNKVVDTSKAYKGTTTTETAVVID